MFFKKEKKTTADLYNEVIQRQQQRSKEIKVTTKNMRKTNTQLLNNLVQMTAR